jgi:hypothetical protein
VQNGGRAQNGFREIGLMGIKNSMLITTANGTIGNILHGSVPSLSTCSSLRRLTVLCFDRKVSYLAIPLI